MKKSYLYFIVPVLLTALFSVYYFHYASLAEQRLERMHQEQVAKRNAELAKEAKQREKAIADAVALTNKRKAEKKAREEEEAREAAARELAQQKRDKSMQDARKYAEQAKQLQKQVQTNKEQIAKIEADAKDQVAEQDFLRQYIKKADANTQSLEVVIQKIDAADKARAEAARLAAKKS